MRRGKKKSPPPAPRRKQAKGASAPRRSGKTPLRAQSPRDAGRAVADARELSPLAELIQLLRAKKIRFMVAGMSGAILQGVPASTLDTDLWIDLPERQYMRLVNLSLTLGATQIRNTVVALRNGSLVNFLFSITGLASFETEWRRAKKVTFHFPKVRVVPLEKIIQSKECLGRPKDLAHLPLLRDVLIGRKAFKDEGIV
jgi:hypothetical protein